MLFWILAGLFTVLAALVVVSPILRRRRDATISTTSDLAVYRDQLKELDGDVARGILSSAEAEGSRTEISRRLLAADSRKTPDATLAPIDDSRNATIGLVLSLIVGALGLYNVIGSPGTPDQPLAERTLRINQEDAEKQFAQNGGQPPRALNAKEADLLERLRGALAERPNDLTGYRLLVQTLNSIGDFAGASAAQQEVIRILGDDVTPQDYAEKAELMIFAAGGYVSPQADQSLAQALQLNATNQRARYYSGISMAQNGKPELAMQLWAGLLKEGSSDAPWKEPVRHQMQALAASSGLSLPPRLLPGPDQDDIEAAAQMPQQERQDMIRGMVERLSDRLATEGGAPEEWARLIRALGVLGDKDQAQAIYDEAQDTFARDAMALDVLDDAAKSLAE